MLFEDPGYLLNQVTSPDGHRTHLPPSGLQPRQRKGGRGFLWQRLHSILLEGCRRGPSPTWPVVPTTSPSAPPPSRLLDHFCSSLFLLSLLLKSEEKSMGALRGLRTPSTCFSKLLHSPAYTHVYTHAHTQSRVLSSFSFVMLFNIINSESSFF